MIRVSPSLLGLSSYAAAWIICTNAGQVGLGSSRPESSRPGSSRPGPILSLVGMCLIKKEFIQQKLEEGCLILRNIIYAPLIPFSIPHQGHSIPVYVS